MQKYIYPWKGLGLFILFASIGSGGTYIIAQWKTVCNVKDPIFVVILMVNAFLIFQFTAFIKSNLSSVVTQFERDLSATKLVFDGTKMIEDMFDVKRCVFVGIVFAAIFFLCSLLLAPWKEEPTLNYFLATFLFLSNLLTGMALASMLVYFKYSFVIASNVEVKLWDRSNGSAVALVDINRYMVLAVAFIASTGAISIMFSIYQFDDPLVIFLVFSVLIILTTYIAPLIPMTTQLRKLKKAELEKISRLIEIEYSALLELANNGEVNIDKNRFDTLSDMHKTIQSKRVFPPVEGNAINTTFLITLLTMAPSVIKLVFSL